MRNYALALIVCCCLCPSAPADFVGVVSESKTDAETVHLCGEANGADVPFPPNSPWDLPAGSNTCLGTDSRRSYNDCRLGVVVSFSPSGP